MQLLRRKLALSWSFPVLEGHWPHTAMEHLKSGWPELGCAVSVKYTQDFEDLVLKKECKVSISNLPAYM